MKLCTLFDKDGEEHEINDIKSWEIVQGALVIHINGHSTMAFAPGAWLSFSITEE